jgi:hypothetical protein
MWRMDLLLYLLRGDQVGILARTDLLRQRSYYKSLHYHNKVRKRGALASTSVIGACQSLLLASPTPPPLSLSPSASGLFGLARGPRLLADVAQIAETL